MKEVIDADTPWQYRSIEEATQRISFDMASDIQMGSLLKTLVASKKSGNFLELGTGTGLATSWILRGMDKYSHLITIDINPVLLEIAENQLADPRIEFVLADGYHWLQNYSGKKFDLVFADAMPGKYDLFDTTLGLINIGGFYVVDDMIPQANWPNGHAERVNDFVIMLEKRRDITQTRLNWSTGIIVLTKIRETVDKTKVALQEE